MTGKRFDIAVIGGGAAGVSAAVAAAKNGASVILLDRNLLLGGLASNAEVGTICGLYKGDQPGFEFNVGKFAREFSEVLQEKCGKKTLENSLGLKYLPYQPLQFADLCREMLRDAGIEYIRGELIGVEKSECRIQFIEINVNGQNRLLEVGAVVDASGVSEVSRLLGIPMLEWEFRQSVSQIFTLRKVNFTSEENLGLILLKAIRKGILSGDLEPGDAHCSLVPGSLSESTVSLKISIPSDGTSQQESELLRARCLASIKRIVKYLESLEPAFEGVELESIAPTLGIRVSERVAGKKILANEDVLAARKSTQFIARGNWPIEIWGETTRVEIQSLPKGEYYDIPMDCLISASMDNLYFAGRCIAATDRAIASARVIGTCLQTGYAAGMYGALRLQLIDEEEAIRRIQSEQFEI